jgi:alpha-amylase/alpha-mannosidase (GH57 family)
MHQPYYRNPFTRKFELPWARLHGIKDYYGMVALLRDFPGIKATYNLVPSLLDQIESYLSGEQDMFQEIFLKDVRRLTPEEVRFMVRHFFSANYDHHIKPYTNYRRLLEKKNRYNAEGERQPLWEKIFHIDELRDLQVWFQLTHFDEEYKQKDERVQRLMAKTEHFTEADKREVEALELEILGKIIPEYRELSKRGQVELSTTPYYHPILPLLVDPQEGREANPGLPEYELHFNWREDARYQLTEALDYMEKTFGCRPQGIWPSEGSLSMEVLEILESLGIKWTATDEANLARSLGTEIRRDGRFNVRNPDVLYRPYRLRGQELNIFFRDHHLSDLIGFHYQKVPYERAAHDLVERLTQVPPSGEGDYVVPIILDGENAWEYYTNSGRDFLREFFRLVQEDERLETVTFSEAVSSGIEAGELTHLCSGSWINANFDIWIGDEDDRKGWKLLEKTKNAVAEHGGELTGEQRKLIREYLSIAQGSDWFWWFGKENYTPDLDIFDRLFRQNLKKVFEVLGREVPVEFKQPIPSVMNGGGRAEIAVQLPTGEVKPTLDGKVGHFFEWLGAGRIKVGNIGGAMNISHPLVEMIYFGFDGQTFYFRVDTNPPGEAMQLFKNGYSLDIVMKKGKLRMRFPVNPSMSTPHPHIKTAAAETIESAVPLKSMTLQEGDEFQFQLEWRFQGDLFQVIPFDDYFTLNVPTKRDYSRHWFV